MSSRVVASSTIPKLTPNSLSILAEDYQEYLEIFFIPLAATLLVPMSFSEMYLTLCYTIVSRRLHLVFVTEPRSRC